MRRKQKFKEKERRKEMREAQRNKPKEDPLKAHDASLIKELKAESAKHASITVGKGGVRGQFMPSSSTYSMEA